jgi:hypothetical protein
MFVLSGKLVWGSGRLTVSDRDSRDGREDGAEDEGH